MDTMDLEETHPEIFSGGPTEAMCAKWDAEWGERRERWSGEWPGLAECREFGWYVKWVETDHPWGGTCWQRCGPEDPDARGDLNRLAVEARWDADKGRFVRRGR